MRFISLIFIIIFFPRFCFGADNINVCTQNHNPPYAFLNEDNVLQGFDIDMLNSMELPYTINLINKDFSASVAGLSNNECDMILSSVHIKPNSINRFLFAKPHINTGLYAAVLENSPMQNTDNLAYSIVGVIKGSSAEEYAFKHLSGSVIYALRNKENLLQMLNEGRIEAILDSLPLLQILIKNYKNIRILKPRLYEEQYAYIFARNRLDLHDKVDNAISNMQHNGTTETIYKKWFGTINTEDN